jgi:hypothetical protein
VRRVTVFGLFRFLCHVYLPWGAARPWTGQV